MAESYSVTAILSARDKNFSSVFGSAQSAADSLAQKLSSGLGFGVLVGIGQKAFSALTSAASGFTNELESTSAAWQTFEKNASMNGHLADDIASTKKELQDFATQTIYSASDMATTYAQLDAVGIASAESLVKGFGGIASAAENPAQAMKTLSQQGVQMAAKPKVAWQDFKLMLEQTPAGIAAVAKEMDMSTAEMVQAVQGGEIATNDFFNAVEKVGTSDAFMEMATQYKTVSQAMDGLSETVTNKLMPTFEKFQSVGIKAVEGIIGALDGVDGEAIAGKIGSVLDLAVIHFKRAKVTIDKTWGELRKSFEEAGIKMPEFNYGSVKSVLDDVSKKFRLLNKFIRAHSKEIAGLVKILPSLAGAFAALKIGQKFGPDFINAGKALGSFAGVFTKTVGKGQKMVSFFKGPFEKIGGIVSKGAGKAIGGASGLFDKFVPSDTLLALIKSRVPQILGPFGKLGSGIAGTAANASKLFVSYMSKMMSLALKVLAPGVLVGAVLVGLGLLYKTFQTQIDATLDMVKEKGPELITNFVNGITAKIPELISTGAQLVGKLLETITALAPALINGGINLIAALAGGVAAAAPTLIPQAVLLITTLATGIISNIPRVIAIGMNLLAGLAQGIANSMPLIVQQARNAIVGFVKGVIAYGPVILQYGVSILKSLVLGIISALPYIVEGAKEAGKWFVDTIMNTDWLKVGSDIINGIVNGVKSGFTFIKDAVTEAFSGEGTAEEAGAQVQQQTAESVVANTYVLTDAMSTAGDEGIQALTDSLTSGSGVDVSGIMGAIGMDGADALTEAMSSIDLTGIGTEASGTVTTEFDTGLAELSGITDNAGAQVISSLQQTGTQAVTTTRQTTTKVIAALKAGINPAKAAGKSVGAGFAAGIRGETANASSAGSAVKNSALSGMSGGYGSAYSHGSNIGQGLVDGMRSKIAAAWAAADELAAAADKAIHARAQIGSPSKITIKYGGWIAKGLAVGIKNGVNGVVKQGKILIDKLYKQMKKSTKKLGGAKDAASTYLKSFRSALQDKAKSDLEYVESSLKKYRDVNKSYNATITSLMKSYKTAYNNEIDKIITSVSTKLTNLANTYQTKYNNIINAQKDFRDTLRSTNLYSADEYGNVALADFASQNRAIKQYQANISKLKKLLPESMMDEILGMSRENGLAYTNELLKKSGEWIKAYGKQYSVVMNTSSKVASSYYSGRVTALQKSYAEDLKKIYSNAKKDMDSIGKNVVQGLINGMKSKKGALDATGRTLAQVVEDAFKKQLKIKSPSRVMTDAGEDTGQGVINGIENKVRAARAAMTKLIDATSPEAAISRRSGNMNLSDEYDYRSEAHYTIVVESTLDGKKVGEGVADYVDDAINRKNKRETRKRGRRT